MQTHAKLARIFAAVLLALVLHAGCGDDPAAVTGPITLTISSINESDIDNGVVWKDKNISSESGNPWGEFIDDAQSQLGGDPSEFEFISATVTLDVASSDEVAGFEDVAAGSMRLMITRTNGDTPVIIAELADPSGTEVDLPITASRSDLATHHSAMVGGDFKARLELDTDLTKADDDFSMDVSITLEAAAY